MRARVHKEDFYAILGLHIKSDQNQLRQAYLQLARQHHPDRNPGDQTAEERFKSISQAYAILSDPVARRRYDRLRQSKVNRRPAPHHPRHRPTRESGPEVQAARRAQTAGFDGDCGRASAQTTSGASQTGASQTGASQTGASQTGASQTGASQTGASQTGASQTDDNRREGRGADAGRRRSGFDKPGSRRFAAEPDVEDLMADLFKTAEGRSSLKKMQDELNKAGLGTGLERLMAQLRSAVTDQGLTGVFKSSAGRLLKKLRKKFFANPLSGPELLAPGDIIFGLALSPEAAAAGTTINLNYQRDDLPHRLSVRIPAGLTDQARLRVPGQGHLTGEGLDRGDLLLDLTVRHPD
ncbi:MAG: DnaJ domain-containing protein [Deltaproteobacteria bacterium]|nr:DnaJ domain-containing protein [Deltaproteobacteria bacterium]